MTAAPRQGWLCGGPGSARAMLDAVFDAQTETFQLERSGQYWQAVEVARARAVEVAQAGADEADSGPADEAARAAAPAAAAPAPAKPRVIAVVDSGFDLSIGRLARAVHPASRLPATPRPAVDPHGTLVALLINEVAPTAQLLLVEARQGIQLWSDDVAEAITYAARSGADLINLSLEFASDAQMRRVPGLEVEPLLAARPDLSAVLHQVRLWRDLVEPYDDGGCRRECELCATTAALRETSGAVVVAASGNLDDPACPACSPGVVGVGFHGVEVATVRDGRVVTSQTLPRTGSNLIWEVSVPEPPGFEGTSFASPLLTALAALQDDPAELVLMARLPRAMTPVMLLGNALAGEGRTEPAALAVWQGAMVEFAQVVPARHRHWEQDSPAACSPCSLAMVDWYNAFTVLRLLQGDLYQALAMARLAATVAPLSPSAHGNLGETWSRWYRYLPDDLMPPGEGTREDYGRRARASFERAAELAPDVPIYRERAASS